MSKLRIRCWFLLFLALPAICAAPEGILRSSPGTTVDGTVAPDGMHIFGGQILRTPHGQFGDLLTRGTSLRLLSDTKLEFDGDSAELIEGGVALTTSTKFRVHTGCADVVPAASSSSRYTVQLQQKTVYITADDRDLTVRAKKEVRVPTHKTVAVYCGAVAQDIVFLGREAGPKIVLGAGAAGSAAAAVLPRNDISAESPE